MKKTAAVVCASLFNGDDFLEKYHNEIFDIVIAVDGGYSHLKRIEVQPNVAIGDFDSLDYMPEGVECIEFPSEKDDSDFALALQYCDEQDVTDVFVYGALGERLDHSFAAVAVAGQYARIGGQIELIGTAMNVKPLFNGQYLIPRKEAGKIVSIFSARDLSRGVSIEGLKYNIDSVSISNITSLGLSNEQTGEQGKVTVDNGLLYVFYEL